MLCRPCMHVLGPTSGGGGGQAHGGGPYIKTDDLGSGLQPDIHAATPNNHAGRGIRGRDHYIPEVVGSIPGKAIFGLVDFP